MRFGRLCVSLFVLVAVALLTGCRQNVDLEALAALSKSVGDSQAAFASLSEYLHQSCAGTVGWQRAADPNTFSDCAEEARAARQWTSADSVVTAYIASLGALAGGASDPGDYGISDFFQTLGNAGVTKTFKADQLKAATGFTKSLIDNFFKVKRREELATVIPAVDASLNGLIATLKEVARTNYVNQLTSERTAVKLFFEPNIARAKPGLETLYAFPFRETEREEQAKIDDKQAAIANYIAALDQISATHHKIAEAIKNNRTADVAGIIRGYAAEYGPDIRALQKAFK